MSGAMRKLLLLVYMASWLWLGGGIVSKSKGHTLTSSDVSTIKSALKQFFNFTGSGAYGLDCNAKLVTCRVGDNIGALVRLVFHDAAGVGGPNGCLDFVNIHDHRGLETVVSQLDTFYRQRSLSSTISLTDLWILAGAVAIEYASNSSGSAGSFLETLPVTPGGLVLPFSYGRFDSSTCNDTGLLPSADYDWSKMKGLFVDRFGMSTAETVAIMGAHSLGRAEWKNSGFEGGWVTTQSSFSNQYYIELGTIKWNNSNNSAVWLESLPGKSPETVMLQVDVELLYKSKQNSPLYCSTFASYTSKQKARCPQQTESFPHVMSYANSITQFFANFSTAWEKMVTLNTTGLAPVGTPTNGSYPFAADETAAPSSSPSQLPTLLPSNAPATGTPTCRPTKAPTKTPTLKPSTTAPTVSPTKSPSATPTTASPTMTPSAVPTTASPTASPSTCPSTLPSPMPTPLPSALPGQPTYQPSTASPSIRPTSAAPTCRPSASPTTKSPTNQPSFKPTSSPSTRSPTTQKPSESPSLRPSANPTTAPSKMTSPPTSQPSKVPGAAASSNNELPIATIAIYGGGALAVLIAGGVLIVYFSCYRRKASGTLGDSSVVDIDDLFDRPNSRFEMTESAKFRIDKVATAPPVDTLRDKRNPTTVATSSGSDKLQSSPVNVMNPIRQSTNDAVPRGLVSPPQKPHRHKGLIYDAHGKGSVDAVPRL